MFHTTPRENFSLRQTSLEIEKTNNFYCEYSILLYRFAVLFCFLTQQKSNEKYVYLHYFDLGFNTNQGFSQNMNLP